MPHVPDTVPGKRVTDAGARTEGREARLYIGEVAEGNEGMERGSGRRGSRRNRRRAGHCAGNPCCRTSGVWMTRPDALAKLGSQHCCITSTLPRSKGRFGGSDGPPARGSTG